MPSNGEICAVVLMLDCFLSYAYVNLVDLGRAKQARPSHIHVFQSQRLIISFLAQNTPISGLPRDPPLAAFGEVPTFSLSSPLDLHSLVDGRNAESAWSSGCLLRIYRPKRKRWRTTSSRCLRTRDPLRYFRRLIVRVSYPTITSSHVTDAQRWVFWR